jgi:hypothetical protein
MSEYRSLFRIRTITCFISLGQRSKDDDDDELAKFEENARIQIKMAVELLVSARSAFQEHGYVVQTLRIATNDFGEWIDTKTTVPNASKNQKLEILESILLQENHGIVSFCALGAAQTVAELGWCKHILLSYPDASFSCSANLRANDASFAKQAAILIHTIAKTDPLANFRFCVSSGCDQTFIPFFPAAKTVSRKTQNKTKTNLIRFAIGLENGELAHYLLLKTKSIANIDTFFRIEMGRALESLQNLSKEIERNNNDNVEFVGIDTSLNPSLEHSVAASLECLDEVRGGFGGPGTLASAASITQAIQNLPQIQNCGYSGLMLPVCEDMRLAELSSSTLRIETLLHIANVCGVGIDTVPIPGDDDPESLDLMSSILLDVAGLAYRWQKPLTCRVFPLPGKKAGEITELDSPYLINAHVMPMSNRRL